MPNRRIRLTDRNLRSLPAAPDGSRLEYSDTVTPGLRVRVSGNGGRTFVVWYRFKGHGRRHTIGKHPPVSLASARGEALAVLAGARLGQDIGAERVAARSGHRGGGVSFLALCRQFLEHQTPNLAPRTLTEYSRAFDYDIPAQLAARSATDIQRSDIRRLVESVTQRGALTQANRTFSAIRRVFNWAVAQGLLETSPCFGLRALHRERPKDRVYSDDELSHVVAAAAATPISNLVLLLLLTAVRSDEARSAKWADIDLPRGFWRVPAARTKNRHPHTVPLSEAARELLAGIPRESEWVFPGSGRAGYLTQPKRSIHQIRRLSGVRDFTPHDIRRTVATRLAELGAATSVIEGVLGHTPPRLVGTYVVREPIPAMAAALEQWGAYARRFHTNSSALASEVRDAVAAVS